MKNYFNETDKLQHMLAGLVSAQLFVVIAMWFMPYLCAILVSAVAAVALMGAKELIWDKWLRKGVCNIKDFYAGLIGIFTEELLSFVYFFMIH